MSKLVDMTGQRFGHVTVVRRADVVSADHKAMWLCHCSVCGNEKPIRGYVLRRGQAKSCGCLRTVGIHLAVIKHGWATRANTHPIWWAWQRMMRRCNDPKIKDYYLYGGRGIEFALEWHNFDIFRRDMEPTWQPGLTLDRYPNKNGNYEKTNCRWATSEQQNNNKRNNVYIDTPKGRMLIFEAAKLSGIKHRTLWWRWMHDVPSNRMFDAPVNGNRFLKGWSETCTP